MSPLIYEKDLHRNLQFQVIISYFLKIIYIERLLIPNKHAIKDIMRPSDQCLQEATINPKLISSCFQTERDFNPNTTNNSSNSKFNNSVLSLQGSLIVNENSISPRIVNSSKVN